MNSILKDELVSVRDLNQRFPNLSVRQIRKLIYDYQIPYQKIGQFMVIREDDIKPLEYYYELKKLRDKKKE